MAEADGLYLESFVCPISQDVMDDPVLACDGHTYERVSIEAWFDQKDTSPVTNTSLDSKQLVPNHALKKVIDEYTSYESHVGFIMLVQVGLQTGFHCPLSRHVMSDPIVASDGHSYERIAFEKWCLTNDNSPVTGNLFQKNIVLPNHALKQAIAECPELMPSRKTIQVVHHLYVRCDECQMEPIRGIRYKSSTLNDYDLCASCEAMKEYESNGPFLKIHESTSLNGEIKIHTEVQVIYENMTSDREQYAALLHYNTTCNGCSMAPIQGVLYRSSIDMEYSVCANCEDTRSHKLKEPFLKIKSLDSRDQALAFRLEYETSLFWSPSFKERLYKPDGLDWTLPTDTLLLCVPMFQIESNSMFGKFPGRVLGMPDPYIYVLLHESSTSWATNLPIEPELHVFGICTNQLRTSTWPESIQLPTSNLTTTWLSKGDVVSSDAILLDTKLNTLYYRLEHSNTWLYLDAECIERLEVLEITPVDSADTTLQLKTPTALQANTLGTNQLSMLQPDRVVTYARKFLYNETTYIRARVEDLEGWIIQKPPSNATKKRLTPMDISAGALIHLSLQVDSYAMVLLEMEIDGVINQHIVTHNTPSLKRCLHNCINKDLILTQMALGPRGEWYCSARNLDDPSNIQCWTSDDCPDNLRSHVRPNALVTFGCEEGFFIHQADGMQYNSQMPSELVGSVSDVSNIYQIHTTRNESSQDGYLILAYEQNPIHNNLSKLFESSLFDFSLGKICHVASIYKENIVFFDDTFLATDGISDEIVDTIDAFYTRHRRLQRLQRQEFTRRHHGTQYEF